jgi:hypothetical protein
VSSHYVSLLLFTSAGYIPDYLNRNLALQTNIQRLLVVQALQDLLQGVMAVVGVVGMVAGVVVESIYILNLL